MLAAWLRGARLTALLSLTDRKKYCDEDRDCSGCDACLVTAAGAADIPRPQPVYQTAQIGKMPIGKTPIGKTPVGKTPVAARPYARY
jgi:hypothetical protein